MMLATAIITAPRPRATLLESLRSFRHAGFVDHVFVAADGPFDGAILDLVTYAKLNHPPLGNSKNWTHALTYLLNNCSHEWLMVCEDDIVWASYASEVLHYDLQRLSAHKDVDRFRALSLYLPDRVSKYAGPLRYGWHYNGMQMGAKLWGAQCLLFRRDWAKDLLEDQLFKTRVIQKDKNIDGIVAESINQRGRVIAYRVPCLVDHTLGDNNSSLGYGDRPNLRTKYFKRDARV